MAFEIVVPRLGWSMDEGVFAEWLKRDGEVVAEGDLLFVLESDKAAQEIESMDAGILRIPPDAPKPGETVAVGQILGYLVEGGEASPFEAEASPGRQDAVSEPMSAGATPAQIKSVQSVSAAQGPAKGRTGEAGAKGEEKGRAAISPRARRLAAELGVDWSVLQGSGQTGRIRESDIRDAASAPAQTPSAALASPPEEPMPGKIVPVTQVRRTIAERMLAGLHDAAPVTLNTRAQATNLVNLRRQFKAAASSPDDISPTYTDLIAKLASVALEKHPMLNAQWRKDGIFIPDRIDIAIAVATESGVVAPVLRDVGHLTLRQIAFQSRTLIGKARARRLAPEEMRQATFTITNLGSHGIDTFTPIIRLPQCSILGVGRILFEPVVVDREIVAREMLSLSLTFDHRVVDGAPAAQFLDTIRSCIEQPGAWLMP